MFSYYEENGGFLLIWSAWPGQFNHVFTVFFILSYISGIAVFEGFMILFCRTSINGTARTLLLALAGAACFFASW